MDAKRFEEIMEGDSHQSDYDRCAALLGLNLIAKYLPDSGIWAAYHDQIFACSVDELLGAGLTEEDAMELRNMGWFVDKDSLVKFV